MSPVCPAFFLGVIILKEVSLDTNLFVLLYCHPFTVLKPMDYDKIALAIHFHAHIAVGLARTHIVKLAADIAYIPTIL